MGGYGTLSAAQTHRKVCPLLQMSMVKGSGKKPAILKYCTHKYIHTLLKSPDFLEKHSFSI